MFLDVVTSTNLPVRRLKTRGQRIQPGNIAGKSRTINGAVNKSTFL